MSTESSANYDPTNTKITLTRNDDGWWTARDETRGLTTQGETRDEALATLDDVIDAVWSTPAFRRVPSTIRRRSV